MRYTFRAWFGTKAVRRDVTTETLPACPGNPSTGKGCARIPSHVLTWTRNVSGLPGGGEQSVYLTCHHHIHTVLSIGERLGGHVTVTAYKGLDAADACPES